HVDTATETDPSVSNTANVVSDEDQASNTTSVAIAEDVHLAATKAFANGAVDAGTDGHTFMISVKNIGLSQADDLSVSDTVDSRLIVTNLASGDYTCPDADSNPQTITCTLAHLDSGATKPITVTYKVGSSTAAATVDNTASATADDGGSDSATAHVGITTAANVANVKLVSDAPHIAGTSVTYTSTVSNLGPSDAQAVTLTDSLDSHLTGATYCTGHNCVPAAIDHWTGSLGLGTI